VQTAATRGASWHPRRIQIMALSQLQVNVLRTVADEDTVPVAFLVACHEHAGTRRTVARAALSRSLRRLWRLGAVELRGTRGSLNLGQSTARLMALETRRRSIHRLVWRHLAWSSKPSTEPIPSRVYVRAVAITPVGRDLLTDAEGGRFPVWRKGGT
jgi:hypothetical protein